MSKHNSSIEKKIFISYAREDQNIALRLYRDLISVGLNPWIDKENLLPGQDWKQTITKAIGESSYFIALLSTNSISKKGYIQKELRIAIDVWSELPPSTIFIIPVRLEECEPPKRIRRWQYADYFPEDNRTIAYQRLLESLRFGATRLGISTKLIHQKDEKQVQLAAPPRSANVFGAITSASPVALKAGVSVLQGVGSTRETLLAELGLYTLGDMLYYFPQSYDKYSQSIIPIYSLTEGISQKWFRSLMETVVKFWAPAVPDTIPENIRFMARLMPVGMALLNAHFPTSQDNLWAALERLTFNEAFYLQLVLLRQKREWKPLYTKHFNINDSEVIERARDKAQILFAKDSELSLPEHSLLAEALEKFWADSSYFDDSMF